MNRDQRIVNEWVRSVTTDGLGAPPRVVEAIDRLTAKRPARKHLAPGRSKEQRKAQRAAELAIIRAYVNRRDPFCMICLEPAPEPWELHHADSGSGKAQRQSPRNCFKTHEECHRKAHRGDTLALEQLARSASNLGYSETAAILLHRIDKIHEAQRTERTAP